MKAFAVLAAVCISAVVASPQAYGSYSHTPAVVRVDNGYQAPVVRVSSSGYEHAAPAAYSSPVVRQEIPIVRYSMDNQNNGNFHVETLGADQTSMSMEGTLKHVAGPESEGPVTVMKGSYSYTGPDNKVYTLTYTANENGFMPMADFLPTPHPEIAAALRMMGAGAD